MSAQEDDVTQIQTCLCLLVGANGYSLDSQNYSDDTSTTTLAHLIETTTSALADGRRSTTYQPTPASYDDISERCYKLLLSLSGGYNNTSYVLETVLYNHISTAICIFGLLGNLANVFFLVPQGRKCGMRRMEKSVYWGLVSLAASDLMFCFCVIPRSFVNKDPITVTPFDFSLLYFTYGDALAHLCTMISTWLTVAMAVGRYLAICKPFTARAIIGTTAAKRTIAGIILACILMSLPRFFFYRVESVRCYSDMASQYFRWPVTGMARKKFDLFDNVYNWFYIIVGIVIPFLCLIFSNAFLIKTLGRAKTTLRYCRVARYPKQQSHQQLSRMHSGHQHQQQQQQLQAHHLQHQLQQLPSLQLQTPHQQNNNRQNSNNRPERNSQHHQTDQYRPITLTLIVLVVAYVVLVTPSELFLFLRRCFLDETSREHLFNSLASLANVLQAANFSLNFLLYYAINVNFRRSVAQIICCLKTRNGGSLSRLGAAAHSPNANDVYYSQQQPESSGGSHSLNYHYATTNYTTWHERKTGKV